MLPALAAVVASAVSGIALAHAVDQEAGGPSSVTRAGLTVQLPPGWEESRIDRGGVSLSSAIAAAPPGATRAGFVVGRLGSEAVAERILERNQSGGADRTQVRLGAAYAWRYAGLQPRPRLVGVGYLVPVSGGAVVMLCHASEAAAEARLVQCGRAATTLVVPGARTHPLADPDPVAQRLMRAIAALRTSRSSGLRRFGAAHLALGQARAATSLERSYERAARSLDRLDDGRRLGSMTAALRAAAEAYGRLAVAAQARNHPAYRDARRAIARQEAAVRRELAR